MARSTFKFAALALEFSEPASFASIPTTSKGDVARALAKLDESLRSACKTYRLMATLSLPLNE